MAQTTRDFCIYALRDPRDKKMRYVGVTGDDAVRLDQHIKSGLKADDESLRAKWLVELRLAGVEPEMVVLEKCSGDWKERCEVERQWIHKLFNEGHDLVNSTHYKTSQPKGLVGEHPVETRRSPRRVAVSEKPFLEGRFAEIVYRRRGVLIDRHPTGLRAAAAEIGISAASLSRVERGGAPDLESFRLLCLWLPADANELLGIPVPKKGESE